MFQFSAGVSVLGLILLSVVQSDAFGFQSIRKVVRDPVDITPETTRSSVVDENDSENNSIHKSIIGSVIAFSVACSVATPAIAVSGGGLDFAGIDISGQDFSNDSKTYKGKDFTQVLAKATNFASSNLQGCRFYKAYLVNADFSDADIRGAALEDTNMEGANLKNTIASGAYFGQSLLDVASAENADFTDATIPVKTLTQFCEREDVKGTNPVTGENTRDSLMCP